MSVFVLRFDVAGAMRALDGYLSPEVPGFKFMVKGAGPEISEWIVTLMEGLESGVNFDGLTDACERAAFDAALYGVGALHVADSMPMTATEILLRKAEYGLECDAIYRALHPPLVAEPESTPVESLQVLPGAVYGVSVVGIVREDVANLQSLYDAVLANISKVMCLPIIDKDPAKRLGAWLGATNMLMPMEVVPWFSLGAQLGKTELAMAQFKRWHSMLFQPKRRHRTIARARAMRIRLSMEATFRKWDEKYKACQETKGGANAKGMG